jgi:5-enolpyruvylshikimate-3-phosphate synthase
VSSQYLTALLMAAPLATGTGALRAAVVVASALFAALLA